MHEKLQRGVHVTCFQYPRGQGGVRSPAQVMTHSVGKEGRRGGRREREEGRGAGWMDTYTHVCKVGVHGVHVVDKAGNRRVFLICVGGPCSLPGLVVVGVSDDALHTPGSKLTMQPHYRTGFNQWGPHVWWSPTSMTERGKVPDCKNEWLKSVDTVIQGSGFREVLHSIARHICNYIARLILYIARITTKSLLKF